MKRFLLAFVLWGGCAGHDPAADLDLRLVAKGSFALGKPMPLALEATNRGNRELCFDVQGLGHGPYEIRANDGSDVPYVDSRAGGVGTFQHFVSVKPGETVTLDEIDLARQFAILEPGAYVARFRGLEMWGPPEWRHGGPEGSVLSGVPESAPLRFTVEAGPLDRRDQVLRALLPARPEGWILYKSDEGLTYQKNRIDGTTLHARVDLFLSETKDATPVGPVWISPLRLSGKSERKPSDDAVEAGLRTSALPALKRAIAKALR